MRRQEVEAQDNIVWALFEDGEQNNCVAISDAYMSGAHSNDRCSSAVGNTDELSRRRREDFFELAAKISVHYRKLSPSVHQSSHRHTVDLHVDKVPFCLYGQQRIFGQSN